ncbi:MAG: glycosyltransferase [Hyphomonadaceae bacterium]
MPPQISIITPSLNQGAFLRHALASVAEQGGVAVEHIALDSGSMDGSRGILRKWAEEGARRQAIFEPDAGPAEAINKGFARAKADVLGWLCADDAYADAAALSAVASVFEAHPECDIVYGRGALIGESGARLRAGPFLSEPERVIETLRAGPAFLQPAAFVRRALLERIGGLDASFRFAFDFEFWLRAARSGASFAPLDRDIVRKRIHAESSSSLLPGVAAMERARATRRRLGRTGPSWVARAIRADVAQPCDAAANVAAAVERRLERDGAGNDFLVVLGNGPSLKGFDFTQLRGVDTVGMNAAYRYWREIGWHPRYYACLDTVLGLSHAVEIEAMIDKAEDLGIDAFLLRQNLIETLDDGARRSRRVINFDELSHAGGLLDIHPLTTGSHAALFGALLGYRSIVLLGVDANYVERVEGAEARTGTELELVAPPAHNPNYFFEGYQRRGDRYNVPNPAPDLHVECWRAAGARLAGRGVAVWNANPTSRVDAFASRAFPRLMAEREIAET